MDPLFPPTSPEPAEPEPEPKPGFLKGRRLQSGILAGGAAFAMTLAGLGIANAQTDDSTSTTTAPPAAETRPAPGPDGHHGMRGFGMKGDLTVAADAIGISADDLRTGLESGKSIAAVATEHGVDPKKVIDALVADAKTHLAQAVTDGKLTQAQADERSADLEARITKLVNSTPPAGELHKGPGRPGPAGMRGGLDAAANAIGISVDELRQGLASGKSMATIAGEHGVDAAKVGEAIVADAKTHLDEAVAAGKLTQAEADARLGDLQSHVDELLNRTGPPHGGPHPEGAGADGGTAPADGAQPAVYTA